MNPLEAAHAPSEALVLQVESVTGRNTVFMKLKDLFPECELLIRTSPQLFPLRCLFDDGCHRGQGCMDKLAHRVKFVFDTFPTADLLMLYFRHHDRPQSHRAGVFWRSMEAPQYVTFNRATWERMKQVGQVYRWSIPNELFLQTQLTCSPATGTPF